MRRVILTAVTALAMGAATMAPAQAISTYNSEPAPEYTQTGAMLALSDTDGDGTADYFDWLCSGAMIDDDTFLSAAHCTSGWSEGTRFYVSLEQDVQALLDQTAGMTAEQRADYFVAQGWAVEGDAHADPAYATGGQNDAHDIAVIDFSTRATDPQDVWDFTPATLPTAGFLDTLTRQQLASGTWTAVGYGTEESTRGKGGHRHPGGGVRMKAVEGFDALNKSWVRLAMNASRGFGGACYGDSGGPNYFTYDGQTYLASTTITGDMPCYATNVTYRLDTESARAFLDPYVTLP